MIVGMYQKRMPPTIAKKANGTNAAKLKLAATMAGSVPSSSMVPAAESRATSVRFLAPTKSNAGLKNLPAASIAAWAPTAAHPAGPPAKALVLEARLVKPVFAPMRREAPFTEAKAVEAPNLLDM